MTNRAGLTITIVDVDPEYLGIEIRAANDRFAGAARIFAGLRELSEFAELIAGFPGNPQDERTYAFGTSEPGFAGGYCNLRLHCIDSVGHTKLDLAIQDDGSFYQSARAEFGFRVFAADIDQFTIRLREIESERKGEANLPMASG